MTRTAVFSRLDDRARLVTAALSARVLPEHDTQSALAVMAEMPARQRLAWMGGALGLLFALALVAAQAGIWGMALYFAAAVALVR